MFYNKIKAGYDKRYPAILIKKGDQNDIKTYNSKK